MKGISHVRATAVPVRDLERAKEFYGEVLGMELRVDASAFNWVEFGPAEAMGRIALYRDEEVGGQTRIHTVIRDIHSFYGELKDRVEFTLPPTRREWGGTVARFLDPDGNLFTVMDERIDREWE